MQREYLNPRPLALLAGRGSEEFTNETAGHIRRIQGSDPKIINRTIDSFENGEIGVELLDSVKGCEVYLVQGFKPGRINDSIIELMLMADALERAGAERINGVLRIYPYARQERREKNKKNRHKRRPISARLVADILSLKFYGIIVYDLHAEAIEGFFSKVKVENIIPFKIFYEYLSSKGILKKSYKKGEKPILVAPDTGSMKKVSDYAENLNLDYAIVNKKRDSGTKVRVKNVIGNVKGKICILIDDISATSGTLIAAKDALMRNGAREVIAMVTHFEGKDETVVKKIAEAGFVKFIITDSVEFPKEVYNYPVFEVLPLAQMMAKVISNIYNSISLQPVVFEKQE